MNANLDEAEHLFEVAAAYAADGGIETAIDRAQEGIALLIEERTRRAKLRMAAARDASPESARKTTRSTGRASGRKRDS